MQVLSKRALKAFWQRHPHAQGPLETWYRAVASASWATPAELKSTFGSTVDFIADNRVIFDIGGNKYRLIVRISYTYQRILIKFVGTHAEYDHVNPRTVEQKASPSQDRS